MSDLLIEKIQNFDKKVINISGNKSIANRAIIIASVASGTSVLRNIPACDDTTVLIVAMKNLGVKIRHIDKKTLAIEGNNGKFTNINNNEIFCKIAGTTSRFMASIALLTKEKLKITGEKRLLERPIDDLCDALIQIGCEIKYLNKTGCVPFEVQQTRELRSKISINCSKSSQFLSSLMLVAPCLPHGLEIEIDGKIVSKSYVQTTILAMEKFGAKVVNISEKCYKIEPTGYISQDFTIEGDFSAASYFFGISTICQVPLRLNGLFLPSAQGDSEIIEIFTKLGCDFDIKGEYIEISFNKTLQSLNINMENMPDSAMTIACVLAFAKGESEISGLSSLKHKETDRLLALHAELAKIGIKTKISDDSIVIFGRNDVNLDKKVQILTYDDHRIAMCFGMIAAKLGNLIICDSQVVSKSMSEFWSEFARICNYKSKIDGVQI